ncbi:hypothetical protein O1611_g1393 [Lasiodiplodia mahajangana]|uniref:Uncharacterized protein n=1 Tax=Lasiodiplodia mahajangana TaxID=1108764 RepID=A0ACC2JXK3_9PEZI|nr:hypothetical protein O1611_g1393 [Lasiodiplodia mahajangana]
MANYPVCCIAEMPIAVLNKLLDQARAGSEELVPNSEFELSVVGTTSEGFSKLLDEATVPPLDDSFKPFVASSLEDASKNIGQAAYFAVLDQQSATDDSAVLVHRQNDGSLTTARATFKSVQAILVSLSMATLGFQEIKSIADSQGGVYGRPTETPRKGGEAPRKRLGGA